MKNIEIGLDGRVFLEKALEEFLVAQGKVRLELRGEPAMAVGIANGIRRVLHNAGNNPLKHNMP